MKAFRKVLVPTVVIAAIGLTAVLYAQDAGKSGGQAAQDALKAMTEHKMTLVSAIEAAEKEAKGQAISAKAQMNDSGAVVLVSCVVGDATKHVSVDVTTGKVTESAAKQKSSASGTTHGKHDQSPKKP
jgi:hypothetical protein